MIKSILTAATIFLTVSPVTAQTINSPKSTLILNQSNGMFSSLSSSVPPSITASVVDVPNNITCRSKARAKYFELGARDMSNSETNSQWGTVGNMQALVWCRDTQAVIVVGGQSSNSVIELRDELKKGF